MQKLMGQKVTVRLDPGNPSEPGRDGTQRNASPVPELVRALCCWSSDGLLLQGTKCGQRVTSPMYSSENMGALDVASRLVEGQIRTTRGRLDQALQIEINITDPTVPWVVWHACWLVNLVQSPA